MVRNKKHEGAAGPMEIGFKNQGHEDITGLLQSVLLYLLLQESESSRAAAAAATSEPGTWVLPLLRPSPLDVLSTGFSFETSSCLKV